MQLHTVPPPTITFTNTSIAPTNVPPSHIQQQQVSQINPASLMTQGLQGSILVVPHSNVLSQGHGFPLLPVFANTAVIMPQNVSHPSLGIETRISTSVSVNGKEKEPSVSSESTRDTKTPQYMDDRLSDREKHALSSDVKTGLTGSRNEKRNINEEEVLIEKVEIRTQNDPSVYRSPTSLYLHQLKHPSQTNSTSQDETALPSSLSTSKSATLTLPSSNLPLQVLSATTHAKDVGETIKIQPHPFLLQTKGQTYPLGLPQFFSSQSNSIGILKVEQEAEMGIIDKHTKSMEILEEVPIRMVERERSKNSPEGVLPQSVLRVPETKLKGLLSKDNGNKTQTNNVWVAQEQVRENEREHFPAPPPPLQAFNKPQSLKATPTHPKKGNVHQVSNENSAVEALTELTQG